MTEFKVGDEVSVKGNNFGHFTVKQIHPNGIHGKKCKMLELEHRVTKTDKTGFIRYYRYIDCRALGENK